MSAHPRTTVLSGTPVAAANSPCFDFLAGPSEMARLIRAKDWSHTPIGSIEQWSLSLRMMVSFLLANRFPMLLWWGPDYISIYNDAYRPILGTKHPRALGLPFRECWSEIRDVLGPLIDAPFRGGPATWMDDIPLEINRYGFLEETHFTIAYSPVPDETAPKGIGGVLATVHEITEKIVGERRLAAMRDLGARTGEAKSAEEACAIAAGVLANHNKDVPFALIYLVDRDGLGARLCGAGGVNLEDVAAPAAMALDTPNSPLEWPLCEAAQQESMVTVSSVAQRFTRIPSGAWPDPPQTAVVVPIRSAPTHKPAAFLVAGVSPRLRLDDNYRGFFDLVAAQVATAISNARAYEDERLRAQALAELDRAKTTFFSNVSHEFRTPLTLMLGPVGEAAAHPETPPALRSQLELAHRNSLRLLRLVNSLLDFSRIEAGRIKASYEPTDLSALTRHLASTFRSAVDRAGLDFIVECDALVDPVYVDPEMWEKIVLNLLSNAFKFTLCGSIRIRLERREDKALLEIADTGVGVPEHELLRLFERFYRVEGTRGRTMEGSGIGLALVQELVKQHGGTISAHSTLGVGTTFCVELPLGSSHLPDERIRPARDSASIGVGAQAFVQEALRWTHKSGAESSAEGMAVIDGTLYEADRRFSRTAGARVLVADDNADMRGYLCQLLSPMYLAEAVADGQQALDAARRQRPDLILSDVMMPHLDGLALLKSLRTDDALRDIPLIMLSARAGEDARVAGLDAGADDYLVKPFSARELMARVGALLEQTRLRRENDAQFRAFVSATSDVVFRVNADWTEMRFLQGQDLIAETPESSKRWLEEHVHPDDQSRVSSLIRDAIREKHPLELELRVRRADESFGWASSRAIPVIDSSDQILEWFGTATDVTERKRVEESLRWQRRILESIASGAPLLESLDELMRFLETQECGARCALLILSDDGAHFRHVCGPSFSVRDRRALEGTSAGSELIAPGIGSVRATPVRGCDGRVLATLAFCFDGPREPTAAQPQLIEIGSHLAAIALERARTEAAESAARLALQSADRQKDEFLAMLAHELRNPLAPIGNASEILARMLPENRIAQAHVGMIKRQTRQLTRLVDDLLDVSRITQGRIQLHRQPIDLTSVVAQAVETVEPQLRDKRHRLVLTATTGYESLYVHGDFARLVQCVVNILSNAAKYTDAGGEISVCTRAEDTTAVLDISDTGPGIAPELLPRIFDLFVQSDRTLDRAQGGLGIGLAVVKRLIDMHGGQVSARSAGLGCGAGFQIRLPRIARPLPIGVHAASAPTRPRRVIIVDDNQDAADSLAALLSLQGHETRAIYSGKEALTGVQSFKPDLALLDIGLPEVNGYELAQRLRAMPELNGIRLVALTGYGQADDVVRTREAGFDEHLVKPVDMAALERVVSEAPRPQR